MNIGCWNCRGTTSKSFVGILKDLRRQYQFTMICLLETHSSGNKTMNLATKSGFTNNLIVDANGHYDGIWCLWCNSPWQVQLLSLSNQYMHLRVGWKQESTWLLTIVYGSPRYINQIQLWDDLRELADEIDELWMVIGDFNAILHEHERRGGSINPYLHGMYDLRNTIHDCNLIDIGFQGSPFTWKGGDLF